MSNRILDFRIISSTHTSAFNPTIKHDMLGWKAYVEDLRASPDRDNIVQIGEAWLLIKGAVGTRELAMVLREAALKLQDYGTVANERPWAPEPEFNPES